MILHFTTATHDIATARVEDTVTGPACNVHSFKNMNMLSRHLSVTNKETCRCQRSKTTAYDIGMLFLHTLRLFRSGKSFIITIGIINALAVFLIFAALCIAVTIVDCWIPVVFLIKCPTWIYFMLSQWPTRICLIPDVVLWCAVLILLILRLLRHINRCARCRSRCHT